MDLAKLLDERLRRRNVISWGFEGSPCDRAIWYSAQGYKCDKLLAREIRLQADNENIYSELIEELRAYGVQFGLKKNKDKALWILEPFVDNMITIGDENYLLAINVLNETCFNTFRKDGLKKWRSEHYEQIQAGMGITELEQAIFLGYNRNTGDLHSELFKFDKALFEDLKSKARSIVNSINPPSRINESKFFYICKSCQFKELCHAKRT